MEQPERAAAHTTIVYRALQEAADALQQALDATATAWQTDPAGGRAVIRHWEDFLAKFLQSVRQRGRETGWNLLSEVSFQRIWSGRR